MDKKVLEDYIDACECIKDTEVEIKKLEKRKKIVQDKVKGSNPDWPYEPKNFNLNGTVESIKDAGLLAREKQILADQKAAAEELKLQVEEWMQEIPFRMQRIVRYKYFNRLSWEEVATLMKAKSGESVRNEFKRFLSKK